MCFVGRRKENTLLRNRLNTGCNFRSEENGENKHVQILNESESDEFDGKTIKHTSCCMEVM